MKILVLNAGSSSQKSCLYELPAIELPKNPPEPLWTAHLDWTLNKDQGILKIKTAKITQTINLPKGDRHWAIKQMLQTLTQGETKVIEKLSEINLVGHRVVHGGTKYVQATLITPEVKQTLIELIPLAPEHNPANLEGIEIIEAILGEIPQIAIFDTAFHGQMPLEAVVYPIPYQYYEQEQIRRYGFHGISHQYCSERAAQLLGKPLESLKIVTCHLGNGCSLAAVKNGRSIDTTMGFTPLEGLMMGTRSGSIDPAILIHLLRQGNLTLAELDLMLNKQSGFQGISGFTSDLRLITQAINEGNQRAKLAFDIFIHRLKKEIAAMTASLGGLDVLVFTAGIGENNSLVREKTCQELAYLGLKLDLAKNRSNPEDTEISSPDSPVQIFLIHTQEDWAIAQQSWYFFNSRTKNQN
jgi:acetate kinase